MPCCLVGSEMCIRDRRYTRPLPLARADPHEDRQPGARARQVEYDAWMECDRDGNCPCSDPDVRDDFRDLHYREHGRVWNVSRHDGHNLLLQWEQFIKTDEKKPGEARRTLHFAYKTACLAVKAAKLRPKVRVRNTRTESVLVHVAYIRVSCYSDRHRGPMYANKMLEFLSRQLDCTATLIHEDHYEGRASIGSRGPSDGPCGCHLGAQCCRIFYDQDGHPRNGRVYMSQYQAIERKVRLEVENKVRELQNEFVRQRVFTEAATWPRVATIPPFRVSADGWRRWNCEWFE